VPDRPRPLKDPKPCKFHPDRIASTELVESGKYKWYRQRTCERCEEKICDECTFLFYEYTHTTFPVVLFGGGAAVEHGINHVYCPKCFLFQLPDKDEKKYGRFSKERRMIIQAKKILAEHEQRTATPKLRYPAAPKRYTSPTYGFTLQYPLVRHWTVVGEDDAGIKFLNKFLGSYMLVMATPIPEAEVDLHDLSIQVDLVKGIVKTMKHIDAQFAQFKHGSAENIVNPHNQIKGCKVIFHFKKSGQAMQGISITYAHKQQRYDLLAYATKKHFDTENHIFFEPIAKSFTFKT